MYSKQTYISEIHCIVVRLRHTRLITLPLLIYLQATFYWKGLVRAIIIAKYCNYAIFNLRQLQGTNHTSMPVVQVL